MPAGAAGRLREPTMRAKTLLILLAVFVFFWFGVSTFRANETLVELRLAVLGPFQVELGAILLGAFFAGAGLILFFDIAGGARESLTQSVYVHIQNVVGAADIA